MKRKKISAGRVQYRTSSDGTVTFALYGNAYPVAYEYDDQNRMVAMATTRNESLRTDNLLTLLPAGETLSTWQPAESDKIDITKWQYDSATGLLTDKVYSDGKGPGYVYTSDGRLSQRIWARGVTTDYKYSFSGSLTNIVYNDSTPYVAYTYNRLGQQLSAVTYDSTTGAYVTSNTFVYTPSLELDYELQNGAKIDRSTDFLGRNTGFSLLNSAEQAVNAVSYSYDAYGRFSALQATTPGDTDTFTYSYLPGTGLISGYSAATGGTASPLSVFRTYERNRNLITAVTNSVGSVPSVVDAFTYHNDALGRRTQRSDYHNDGNASSTTANTFDYNTFSEVTNAVMGSGAYAYNYDPIGNRQSAKLNDDTTSYAANGLNQYTSITEGAVITPTYDLDGNMLTNATHSFTWDAENRLIIASSLIGGVVARYTYDHQSRRIYKTVVNSSILSYISSFTYDGWNLIQEVSTYLSSGTHSTNLYLWGLDLSGSFQGAGGVGGLLSQTVITPETQISYFPLADANGNAVTYLDNAGNVQAHYTYDAFGGTTSQTGDMADAFRLRFSSKYLDEETGFYYYGYRYYSPALGRWLSRDPIDEWGGVMQYGFIGNDGVNSVDVLGLQNIFVKTVPDCGPCEWGGAVFKTNAGYDGLTVTVPEKVMSHGDMVVGRSESCDYAGVPDSGWSYEPAFSSCTVAINITVGLDPNTNTRPKDTVGTLLEHELGHVPIVAKEMGQYISILPTATMCVCKKCDRERVLAVNAAIDLIKITARIENAQYHVSVYKGKWKEDWQFQVNTDVLGLPRLQQEAADAYEKFIDCLAK